MPDLDLIALVDVESTGLNPAIDEVIELGCVLYSLSHNTVLQQVSTLVPVSVDVSPTEHINGVSAGAALSAGVERSSLVLDCIEQFMRDAGAVIAHNTESDKHFWETTALDRGWYQPKVWIDAMAITWPRAHRQGCNLVELALCYDVPDFSNHRALTDCQLLAHIIQREPDAARLLAKELEPKVWATWRSVATDKDGQAKARAAGFRWNRPECPAKHVWSRLMHPDDVAGLSFDVVTMEAVNAVA